MAAGDKYALEPMDMKVVWHCFECKKYYQRDPLVNSEGVLYCPFCSSEKIERIPGNKE
ncbi:MAG: hypothetical protein MUO82_06035 [Candidatus Thermoplasmatota archaeon]|nr:hypothetical protein [Candidatus Thermoplasmatota archaeon]